MVYVKIQPATLLKITSSATNTVTTDSTGAFSTGRMITRSITTPATKETAIVSVNAHQYGRPALSIDHARYVENIAISPWAKFTTSVAW